MRATDAMRMGILAGLLGVTPITVGGCGDDASGSPPPVRVPKETIVVLDRSGSVTSAEQSHFRGILADAVEDLSYGDRLVVLVAHAAGRRNGDEPIVLEMPEARNGSHPLRKEESALEDAKDFGKLRIERAFVGSAVPSTDLIASMHTAVDQFLDATSPHRSLIVMSDMLQCTTLLCIERPGSVPGPEMIADLRESGRLPALNGVCVSAVGPDPSTSHGVEVRRFWTDYFDATEARFHTTRYRHAVPDADLLRCADA